MQTFLPYENFYLSAQCLDRQRLGKQRVEVLQLLKGQFPNHPCAKMWKGYETALAIYGMTICNEWIKRGYKDTCFGKIKAFLTPEMVYKNPPWLGREDFHSAHRAALLFKNPEHYKQFNWKETPKIDYKWS